MENKIINIKSETFISRFIDGALWHVSGAIVYQAFMVLSSVLVARELGKIGFGELGIILSTSSMVCSFISFGLGVTANKFVAEYRESDPEKAGKIIGLSGILAVVISIIFGFLLIFLSKWLASNVLGAPDLKFPLMLTAVIIFFTVAKGSQIGALAGLEAFKSTAIINIFVGISSLIFVPLGAWKMGLLGAIYGNIIVIALNYFMCFFELKRQLLKHSIRVIYNRCYTEINIIYSFSAPAIISSLMQTPIFWVCNIMLVNEIDGYAQMGIYNAAMKFQIMITFCSSYIGSVLFSIMSSKPNDSQDRNIYIFNMLFPFVTSLLISLPILSFPNIIGFMFGPEFSYEEPRRVVIVIALVACLHVQKESLARILSSRNNMWLVLMTGLASSISLLISFFFLKRFGAFGLATSFAISYSIWLLFLSFFCYKLKYIPFRAPDFYFLLSIISVFFLALYNIGSGYSPMLGIVNFSIGTGFIIFFLKVLYRGYHSYSKYA